MLTSLGGVACKLLLGNSYVAPGGGRGWYSYIAVGSRCRWNEADVKVYSRQVPMGRVDSKSIPEGRISGLVGTITIHL